MVVIVEVGVVVLGVEADVTLVVVAVGEEVREFSFNFNKKTVKA